MAQFFRNRIRSLKARKGYPYFELTNKSRKRPNHYKVPLLQGTLHDMKEGDLEKALGWMIVENHHLTMRIVALENQMEQLARSTHYKDILKALIVEEDDDRKREN